MAIRKNSESVNGSAKIAKDMQVLHQVGPSVGRYTGHMAQVVSHNGRVFCVSVEVGNSYCYNRAKVRTQNGDWADITTPVGVKGAIHISYIDDDMEKHEKMQKNIQAMKEYIADIYKD